MARIADTRKLEYVKRVTMELIVEKGFHGVTIAEIAEKADVSVGYIYMYYPDKTALVQSIYDSNLKEFHDHIYTLINQYKTLKEIVEGIVSYTLENASNDLIKIKFILLMVHDYVFDFPFARLKAIKDICEKIQKIGIKTGEIGPNRNSEDVFIVLFSIPLKYLDSRIKNIFNRKHINGSYQNKISEMCLNSLI